MAEGNEWQSLETMAMFSETEKLCDALWSATLAWPAYARETVGRQLTRAADSIGANLVEGEARFHFREKLNFCYIARGSAREAAFWLRRAQARQLLPPADAATYERRLDAIVRWINTLIHHRRQWVSQVREEPADYSAEPPPDGGLQLPDSGN